VPSWWRWTRSAAATAAELQPRHLLPGLGERRRAGEPILCIARLRGKSDGEVLQIADSLFQGALIATAQAG
jgi:hypothetical protein